jgi:serine/threonine protein kinase
MQGYRAPKLVDTAIYSNKVNIWALGSIIVELATSKRLFTSDVDAVLYYRPTSAVEIEIPELPSMLLTHFPNMTEELLHRGPQQRGRIASLTSIFHLYPSYINLLSMSSKRQNLSHLSCNGKTW